MHGGPKDMLAGEMTVPKYWVPVRDSWGSPDFSPSHPQRGVGVAIPQHSTEVTEARSSDKLLDVAETHTASREQSLGLNVVFTKFRFVFYTSLWRPARCSPKPSSSSSWAQHKVR